MGSMMGSMMSGGWGSAWWGLLSGAVPLTAMLVALSLLLRGPQAKSPHVTSVPAGTHAPTAAPGQLLSDPAVADATRASDADREHAVAQLGAHVGAGRLTMDEFDERVTGAYAAATLGQLRALLADLPVLRSSVTP